MNGPLDLYEDLFSCDLRAVNCLCELALEAHIQTGGSFLVAIKNFELACGPQSLCKCGHQEIKGSHLEIYLVFVLPVRLLAQHLSISRRIHSCVEVYC